MFEKLDDYLQQKTQNGVDRIDDVFGVNKFRLAIWSIITAVITCFLSDILEGRFNAFDIGSDLWFVFITVFIVRDIEQQEREFLTTNNLRQSFTSTFPQWVRIVPFLILILHTLAGLYFGKFSLLSLSLLFNVLWLYVDICIPRKPKKSKVRKWIDGLLTSLGEMLEPEKQLVPIRIHGC